MKLRLYQLQYAVTHEEHITSLDKGTQPFVVCDG